jgi:hypothetical protein
MGGGSDLSYRTLGGIILIRLTGEFPIYEQAFRIVQQIAETCRTIACREFLIDATEMTGSIPNVDRFRLMLLFARLLPPNIAVAVLVHEKQHVRDYLLETLLRKYGIDGAEFTDRAAALTWLNQIHVPDQKAV